MVSLSVCVIEYCTGVLFMYSELLVSAKAVICSPFLNRLCNLHIISYYLTVKLNDSRWLTFQEAH